VESEEESDDVPTPPKKTVPAAKQAPKPAVAATKPVVKAPV
jgi:hypothetical protein